MNKNISFHGARSTAVEGDFGEWREAPGVFFSGWGAKATLRFGKIDTPRSSPPSQRFLILGGRVAEIDEESLPFRWKRPGSTTSILLMLRDGCPTGGTTCGPPPRLSVGNARPTSGRAPA